MEETTNKNKTPKFIVSILPKQPIFHLYLISWQNLTSHANILEDPLNITSH